MCQRIDIKSFVFLKLFIIHIFGRYLYICQKMLYKWFRETKNMFMRQICIYIFEKSLTLTALMAVSIPGVASNT